MDVAIDGTISFFGTILPFQQCGRGYYIPPRVSTKTTANRESLIQLQQQEEEEEEKKEEEE
jgi:hypothetical protein